MLGLELDKSLSSEPLNCHLISSCLVQSFDQAVPLKARRGRPGVAYLKLKSQKTYVVYAEELLFINSTILSGAGSWKVHHWSSLCFGGGCKKVHSNF